MKKQILLGMICTFALTGNIQAQITNPTPYCAAQIASLTLFQENHIKAVNIGTLSNNTGTNYVNGSEYVYYNNIIPVNLQKGTNISSTFTVSKNDMELNVFWVYVDYNLNNSFEQTELVSPAASTLLANAPFGDVILNINLNVPSTAQTGQTRMRIIYTSDFLLSPATPTPCNNNTNMFPPAFYYGEIEDYNVNIVGQTVAAPTASFTSPASACKNQSITLNDVSSNTPTAWSWTLTGGTPSTSTAKNPTVKYASAGTYTILFSSSNAGGSSQAVSKTVTISACTGIDENSGNSLSKILAYPNPGNGYFNLENPEHAPLIVYNLVGEKVLEYNLEEGKNTLDLSTQPKGVYFIVIQYGDLQKSLKLIKE